MSSKAAILGALASLTAWSATPSIASPIANVVLIHGMNMDGTSWRSVYNILTKAGYNVTIVQEPLTGFDQDVQAAKRAVDMLEGPIVLVGHSYGGMVISEIGNDPKVQSLVYVAAFQPEANETTAMLNSRHAPLLNPSSVLFSEDGFVTITREGFLRDIAHDLPAEQANFLFDSQAPTTSAVFTAQLQHPAWKQKPSYGIVATEDRVISPTLQRWMYDRAGSSITEIQAGHMVYISHAEDVAAVIIEATRD